jgi:hypothetical protein
MAMDYPQAYRHWHVNSETYTGGDSLVSILRNGWIIHTITPQVHGLSGNRTVHVYQINLKRGTVQVNMLVIANPVVTRLLDQHVAQPLLPSTSKTSATPVNLQPALSSQSSRAISTPNITRSSNQWCKLKSS